MARYIFVTGGVVSSLGKGLSSASLAYLLQSRGYKVRLRKLDPYLNVDPGTMSPFQHGEVFVTDDGAETEEWARCQIVAVLGGERYHIQCLDEQWSSAEEAPMGIQRSHLRAAARGE